MDAVFESADRGWVGCSCERCKVEPQSANITVQPYCFLEFRIAQKCLAKRARMLAVACFGGVVPVLEPKF
jgi:hypothetical protein